MSWICVGCNSAIKDRKELNKHLAQAEKKGSACPRPVFEGDLEE